MTFFLQRWLVAFLLVAATYNPTDISYLKWVDKNPHLPASIVLLAGFVLCFGFAVYVRGALGAVGRRGVFFLFLFFGLVLWALSDFSLVNLNNDTVATWAYLVIISVVFAVGVSWTHLRHIRMLRPQKKTGADW